MTTEHFLVIFLAVVLIVLLVGIFTLLVPRMGALSDQVEFHKAENKKLSDYVQRNTNIIGELSRDINEITTSVKVAKEESRKAKRKLINERDHLQRQLSLSKNELHEALNQAFQCYRLLFSQDRNKSFAKRKLAALKTQAKAAGLRGQIDDFPNRKKI